MSEEQNKHASIPVLSLSEAEIELRKKWLDLTSIDEELVCQELDPLLQDNLDAIVADMYDHFLAFQETKSFFPNEVILNRARNAQRDYFSRLTKGNYDADYVKDRLQIGSTHHRIDLDPKWYMGSYNRVLYKIIELLIDALKSDPNKLLLSISAILKLIFFDMGLAIETYIAAKEAAIRHHRDAIADLETERRVTKNILEDAPIGFVETDTNFVCLECNEEFLKMLDAKSRQQVIGKSLFEIAPQLPRMHFEKVLSDWQSYSGTAELLNFSSSYIAAQTHWDWAVWSMRDSKGKTTGLLAKFSSVTDRVLLQQQREDFVATLTHDLKTPILAANRAVKLLLEGDFGEVSQPQARILDTIHESNEAMYKMVQTLLDVYRYDSGAKKLKLVSHDLVDTVKHLIAELKPLAAVKKIKLDMVLTSASSPVICDIEEIRRVIQNLIDNSLKFTQSEGSVTIEINQLEGSIIVKVTDTGKGIREDDMPKLFQRFWQSSSGGRYYASTGLGLYLCRKIVELHQGRIWCESTYGKGSTFAFTIGNPEIEQ